MPENPGSKFKTAINKGQPSLFSLLVKSNAGYPQKIPVALPGFFLTRI
jgi:hypothetical protein